MRIPPPSRTLGLELGHFRSQGVFLHQREPAIPFLWAHTFYFGLIRGIHSKVERSHKMYFNQVGNGKEQLS